MNSSLHVVSEAFEEELPLFATIAPPNFIPKLQRKKKHFMLKLAIWPIIQSSHLIGWFGCITRPEEQLLHYRPTAWSVTYTVY